MRTVVFCSCATAGLHAGDFARSGKNLPCGQHAIGSFVCTAHMCTALQAKQHTAGGKFFDELECLFPPVPTMADCVILSVLVVQYGALVHADQALTWHSCRPWQGMRLDGAGERARQACCYDERFQHDDCH